MDTDIGLTKQYIRKCGLVWIICIPPVVKDTKKENSTLDFLLDRDVNSILKMWNKGSEEKWEREKVHLLPLFYFFNLQFLATFAKF